MYLVRLIVRLTAPWFDTVMRDKKEFVRGYIAGRNQVKARPRQIVWARNIALRMDFFDHGWDEGVRAGINRYLYHSTD